jgi:CDP-diacylglycerol--inositol 3-phosphatidyltransferase
VHSRSAVVRFYYRHRLFMGFCCICVEVLLLSAYLLRWPQYRAATVAIPLPAPAAQAMQQLFGYVGGRGGAGAVPVPIPALVALLALPGAAVKQLVNVVQLRAATDALVQHDRQAAAPSHAKRA